MKTELLATTPQTLPITVDQYQLLVEHGKFADRRGQVELIYGEIVEMNPQGPQHADPIDELENWSHRQASDHFRIRVEKPVEMQRQNSSPEPEIAWVRNRRYADQHPLPEDVHLLIEVSVNSSAFDRGQKQRLYAEAGTAEYWIVDVAARTIEVMTQPDGLVYKHITRHGVEACISPQCLPAAVLPVAQLFSKSVS